MGLMEDLLGGDDIGVWAQRAGRRHLRYGGCGKEMGVGGTGVLIRAGEGSLGRGSKMGGGGGLTLLCRKRVTLSGG